MMKLLINEPHWDEPIVSEVRSVKEVIEYRSQIVDNPLGSRIVQLRWLEIVHADGSSERFRLFGAATYWVEHETGMQLVCGPVAGKWDGRKVVAA